MSMRVAINGFGRVGRSFVRVAHEQDADIEVVAVNDQIDDGESGVLISDPDDLSEFGGSVVGLLQEPERARRIGTAARLRARDHFLGVHHLRRYFELIQALVAQPADSVAAAERGS